MLVITDRLEKEMESFKEAVFCIALEQDKLSQIRRLRQLGQQLRTTGNILMETTEVETPTRKWKGNNA